MDSEIRYVAATGALGAGVHVESLEKSLEIEPSFIAADAGTTDAGPFSLGLGVPAFAREAVKRDLTALFAALPILRGFPGGVSWQAGKVTEWGTMACEGERGGVLTATIRHTEAI